MKTIELFGKKLDSEDFGYEIIYTTKFDSKEELELFYDKVREIAISKNFRGDPYEWASFMTFEHEGIKLTINAPHASNGDRNWYAYPEGTKLIVTISDHQQSKVKFSDLKLKK